MDWVFSIGIKIIVDLQGMNGTLNRHFCTEVEPIFLEHVKVCLCVSNFIFPDASDVDTDTKLLIISIAFFCSSPRMSVGALSSYKRVWACGLPRC